MQMDTIEVVERPSFVAVFGELRLLLSQEAAVAPRDVLDGFLGIFDNPGKCVVTKCQVASALGACDADRMFQPTDLFLEYIAAFRARDWPKVRVVQHDIRSL